MGADAIPVAVVSVFWAIVGLILPFIVGKGPNAGVIRCVLVISAASCWLFWLCCYMHQMNPLIGPSIRVDTLIAIKYLWDGETDFIPTNTTTTETPA